VRLELEPAGFCFQGDIVVRHALGTQPSRRLARKEIGRIESEKYFCQDRFGARLAGFAGDDTGDVVAALENRVGKLAKHLTAFTKRVRRPFFLRGASLFENAGNCIERRSRDAHDDIASTWINRVYKVLPGARLRPKRSWGNCHFVSDSNRFGRRADSSLKTERSR